MTNLDYFKEVAAEAANLDVKGLFTSEAELDAIQPAPGVRLTPVFGDNLMIVFVRFEPNSVAPVHHHPQQQMGTMIEGEYEFEMNGERRMIRPGDAYVVPPNVPHGARTYDAGCLALDVFSPPREGFAAAIAEIRKGRAGS